jgi:hypothetical protein
VPRVAELGDDDEDRIGLLADELDVLVLAEPSDLASGLAAKLELERGLAPCLELLRQRARKVVTPRLPGIFAGITRGLPFLPRQLPRRRRREAPEAPGALRAPTIGTSSNLLFRYRPQHRDASICGAARGY